VVKTNTLRTRSYSMQGSLNHPGEDQGRANSAMAKYSDIRPGPSLVFVFLDEQESSIDDGLFSIFPNPATYWASLPADRHNHGLNLSFADGHGEHWKWLYQKIFTSLGQLTANAQDLQDLRRLQAACRTP
jgi:prepilin-type processing-associated H-X9-DG protein